MCDDPRVMIPCVQTMGLEASAISGPQDTLNLFIQIREDPWFRGES